MTHSLYKPHVVGPENDITTPDIVVDRLYLQHGNDGGFVPVHRMLSAVDVQTPAETVTLAPAYALIAAGAGVLIGPGAMSRPADYPADAADLLFARQAWRFANLAPHAADLRLSIDAGAQSQDTRLADLASPQELMQTIGGFADQLPRGIVVVCAASGAEVSVDAPCRVSIGLDDAKLGRKLVHGVDLTPVIADRWEERPLPRYTVGPVGDVDHYVLKSVQIADDRRASHVAALRGIETRAAPMQHPAIVPDDEVADGPAVDVDEPSFGRVRQQCCEQYLSFLVVHADDTFCMTAHEQGFAARDRMRQHQRVSGRCELFELIRGEIVVSDTTPRVQRVVLGLEAVDPALHVIG